jgi:hypothetical protein
MVSGAEQHRLEWERRGSGGGRGPECKKDWAKEGELRKGGESVKTFPEEESPGLG